MMSEFSVDSAAEQPRFVCEVLQFFDEWWSTRSHGSFPGGTWILSLGGLLCGLAVVAVTCPDHMFIERYRAAASASSVASDWNTAELMYRRLQDMGCSDSEVQLGLARVAEESGDRDTATALMTQLAASARPGSAQAHFWLARQLLELESPLAAEQGRRLISHLKSVVDQEPDHTRARGLLGCALAELGEWDEAAVHLQLVCDEQWTWKLTLARVEAARGRSMAAAQFAREIVVNLEQELESHPQDVPRRLKLVEACMLCGDLGRAERVLAAGLSTADHADLRRALAGVYLAAARHPDRGSQPDQSETVRLLIRAYAQDARLPGLLETLAEHMGSRIQMPPQLVADVRDFLDRRLHQDQNVTDSRIIIALGQVAVRQGDDQRAITHYRSVATEHPALELEIARAYVRLQRPAAAREAADRAIQHFQHIIQQGQTQRGRILWAHAEAVCRNWEQAEHVLQTGLAQESLPAYRMALANLYVSQAASLDNTLDSSVSLRFELLLKALKIHSGHQLAVTRMAQLIEQAPARAADLELQLKQALANGTSTPVLHAMLGTMAAQQNRFESARFHLEQALHGPLVRPQTLNNLAWVLVRCRQPDPDRALKLINKAQLFNPQLSELRETRGEILLKLKRWEPAVRELEFVLMKRPDRLRLHALLAEAYDGMGETGTADQHRRLAQAAVRED